MLRKSPFSVGVDIVAVDRVRRLLEDNDQAAADIFTAGELRYCSGKRQRYAHLAVRFAAKEAVLKALGTGLDRGMRWTDVEVTVDPAGRPSVRLSGQAGSVADGLGIEAVEISLSHAPEYAVAQALAVGSGARP